MFLHDPSTASSGRKLTAETFGDSYGSFFCVAPLSIKHALSSSGLPTAPTASGVGSWGPVIQDREQNLRACPFAHVDVF